MKPKVYTQATILNIALVVLFIRMLYMIFRTNKSIVLRCSFALLILLFFSVQFGIAANTKTWNGGTGTAKNWTTASNWSPSGVPASGDDVVFNTAGTITFSTLPTASIAYNSLTISQGTVILAGTTRTFTLGGNAGTDFTIASGATLTATNVNIALASNATASIAGTYNNPSGITFNTDGTSVVTTVTGYLANNGTVTCTTASKLLFQSGATYEHAQNSGTIPTATWDAKSTCNITGITGTAPSGLTQSFGNFTWNCTGQTAAISCAGNLSTINGTFTIVNTNVYELRLINSGGSETTTIGGDLAIQGGTLNLHNANESYTTTVNLGGSLLLSSGATLLSGNTTTASTINFTGSGAQFTNAGTLTSTYINYNVNNGASLALNNNLTVSSGRTLTVQNGGTLTLGTYSAAKIVNGTGNFTLASGGTLIISDPYGILTGTSTGSTSGAVQVTGTRSYNNGGNYIYNAAVAQATGTGLSTGANNVTITGGSIKALTSSLTVMTGVLTVDANNTLALAIRGMASPSSVNLQCGGGAGSSITSTTGTLTLGGDVNVAYTGTGSGGASITSLVALGANRTFSVADDGTSAIDLIVSGVISGSGYGIAKTGAGSMVLSGSNTYTGSTTVSAGALALGAANVINNSSNFVLDGGTFATGLSTGYSETVGTLSLTNSSVIVLGSGSHTLTFSNSSGVSWDAGSALVVTGWQGAWSGTTGTAGKIFVGSDATGLTLTQLGQISFYDGTNYYSAVQLPTGEVVPGGTLTVTPATLNFGTTPGGTTSSELTYTLSANHLSGYPGNITVTAPAGFEVSLTTGSGFASSVNVPYSSSVLSNTTIYVHFVPNAASTDFNATISNAGGGAANKYVTVTGTSRYSYPFWFKADGATMFDGTTWVDESSNGNNATNSGGTVTYSANTINFNPSIYFNGVARQMVTANTSTQQSLVVVTLPVGTTDLAGLLGAGPGSVADKGIRLSNDPNDGITDASWLGDQNADDWSYGGTSRINGTSGFIHNFKWHIVNQSRGTSLTTQMYLGGYYAGRPYTGNIAEIMAFPGAVPNQDNVESYLAVKYGITLGHDYLDGNSNNVYAISGYANDIAGLGFDASYGLNQKVSSSVNLASGSARVVMATTNNFALSNLDASRTALANGQYLIWGHNGGAVNSFSTPSAGYYPIVGRIWKAQNSNSVGVVNFQIDLTSFPTSETGMYVLLVSNDPGFPVSGTSQYLLSNTSGNLYYSTVAFPSGTSYFTIGKPAYTTAVYVRQGGRGSQTGDSWTNAMPTIQQAVETSNKMTTKLPVYVAAGNYYQNTTYSNTSTGTLGYMPYGTGTGWNGWANNFLIRSGINVFGGFPENYQSTVYATDATNNNNADLNSRVLLSENGHYETILNGGTDCRVLGPLYTVTPLGSGTGLTTATAWDGFSLTGANMNSNAGGGDDRCGAGVYTVANFTLSNSIIKSNTTSGSTTNDGAGAEMDGGTLYNCIVRNNTTGLSGTGSCAGTVNIRNGGSNVINCLINGNAAYYGGGAISINIASVYSNCYIINNTMANNTSTSNSSGINIFGSASYIYLYNNAIWNNTVSGVTTVNEKYNAWPNGYTGYAATSFALTNPGFVNSTSDFRLTGTSVLLNKGGTTAQTTVTTPAVPSVDIRGIFRDARPDIGCYERAARYYFVNNAYAGSLSNGLNWTTPFKAIQDAMDQYDVNDSTQVWVASGNGNYQPSKNSSGSSSTGSDATFLMKKNLGLFGGFAGIAGTEPTSIADAVAKISSRQLKLYPTIIASNTAASTNLVSYTSSGGSKGAIIDGFIITGGASGGYAVALDSTLLRNCCLFNNSGGGLSLNTTAKAVNIVVAKCGQIGVLLNGAAAIVNATIADNTGYGVSFAASSAATVANSIIWNNNNGGDNVTGTIPSNGIIYTASGAPSAYNTATTLKSNSWSAYPGNIELYHRSPNFKQPGRNNYELLLISPCLGKGSASSYSTSAYLAIDANGKPRMSGSAIDMGAFQKSDGMIASGSTFYRYRSATTYTPDQVAAMGVATAGKDSVEIMVNPATTLTLGGQAINAKWLMLKDSTSVTAPVITGSGSFTVDSLLYVRYFPKTISSKGVWSFFGLPSGSNSLSNIDGAKIENTIRLLWYDESKRAASGVGAAWTRTNGASVLSQGKGYALSFNSKVPENTTVGNTVIFPSGSTSGPVTLTLVSSPSGSVSLSATSSGNWWDQGWNLISNPLWQNSTVTLNASYWPQKSSSLNYYGAVYQYLSSSDSYSVTPAALFYTAGSQRLSPYGAYFIQTDNSQGPLWVAGSTTGTPQRVKSSVVEASSTESAGILSGVSLYQFTVNGSGQISDTYVMFADSSHTDARPLEDAQVMGGMTGRSVLQMNTTASGLQLAINTQPFAGSTMEIPLQVTVPAIGAYTISMPLSDTIAAVYLKDANGKLTRLNDTNYNFTVNDASQVSNFTLVFGRDNRVQQEAETGITLIQNHKRVRIYSPVPILYVYVYAPTGQLQRLATNAGTETYVDLPAADGVYMLKITNERGTMVRNLLSK
jgi:hypothetical protein